MVVAAQGKPRIVTRRIGGLSAIGSPDVQMVIWSRKLNKELKEEIDAMPPSGKAKLDFVTLTTEPLDRIQQHCRERRIKTHHLAHDIALLTTVLGELSGARRIRVQLGGEPEWREGGGLKLAAIYRGASRAERGRMTRPGSQVAVFRNEEAEEEIIRSFTTGSISLLLTVMPEGRAAKSTQRSII